MIEVGRNIERSKLQALLLFLTGRIANCVKSESHHDRHANPIKIQFHYGFSVFKPKDNLHRRDKNRNSSNNAKVQRIDAEYFGGRRQVLAYRPVGHSEGLYLMLHGLDDGYPRRTTICYHRCVTR